jgi:hypothetical protein
MISDGEMERRLKQLERKINAARPSGSSALRIILVGGCFTPPGAVPAFANCGPLWWLRNPDEELLAFARRCVLEVPPGETDNLILGGLPRNAEQYHRAMMAYDLWLASENGVPPMETRPPARSRLGFVD